MNFFKKIIISFYVHRVIQRGINLYLSYANFGNPFSAAPSPSSPLFLLNTTCSCLPLTLWQIDVFVNAPRATLRIMRGSSQCSQSDRAGPSTRYALVRWLTGRDVGTMTHNVNCEWILNFDEESDLDESQVIEWRVPPKPKSGWPLYDGQVLAVSGKFSAVLGLSRTRNCILPSHNMRHRSLLLWT